MWDALSDLYVYIKIVGVAFGVIGGGFIGTLLASPLNSRKARPPIIVGGAGVGGLLMWLALGHVGGGGAGLGPGLGAGKGPGEGGVTAQPGSAETAEPGTTAPGERSGRVATALEVKMLGGDRVRQDRFYMVGDGPPRTWDELMRAVAERQRRPPPLRKIDIVIYRDSVEPENPAVTALKDWAKQQHLEVALSFPPENIPGT